MVLSSLIGFLLLQYQWATLGTLTMLGYCAYKIAEMRIKTVQERGLISYLPRSIQIHLLDRSIFDLLCDIWYIPKASQYLKAFLKPFVQNISPEQAAIALEDLPDSTKKTILTKGLINFFPDFLQTAIMPQPTPENELEMNEKGAHSNQQWNSSQQAKNQGIYDQEDQDSLGSTNTAKSSKKLEDFEDNFITSSPERNRNQIIPVGGNRSRKSLNGNSNHNHGGDGESQLRESNSARNKLIVLNEEDLNEDFDSEQPQIGSKNNQLRRENGTYKEITKNKQHDFSFNNNLFQLSQNEPNTFVDPCDNTLTYANRRRASKNPNTNPSILSQHTSSEDDAYFKSNQSTTFFDIFHNRGTFSDDELPRTKLIASSCSMEEETKQNGEQQTQDGKGPSLVPSLKPMIADKWDKLHLFSDRLKTNCMKLIGNRVPGQGAGNNGTVARPGQGANRGNLLNSAKMILGLFNQVMELKKMGNLSQIDNKKLIKVFLISSVFMGAQVFTSRRARKWMINTSLMFLYVLSFLLTTGTFGIMLYQYNQSGVQKQLTSSTNAAGQSMSGTSADQRMQHIHRSKKTISSRRADSDES